LAQFKINTSFSRKIDKYTIFVREPEEERPLGRPRSRWEDNIKNVSSSVWIGYPWLRTWATGGLL
jgi:hypothetical protein